MELIRQESYFSLCSEGNEHLVIERIKQLTDRGKNMTPQEELFAKYFNNEKILVKDMDTLQLRAHREELSAIAFEARARLTAVDKEESERNGIKRGGVSGLERNLNQDETSSNAINAINNRNQRLNKKEKLRKSLEAMGVEAADIEKIMSARNIRDVVEKSEKPKTTAPAAGGIDWDKIVSEAKEMKPVESKPVFNPFAKEPEPVVSNEPEAQPTGIVNPFAK